MLELKNLQYCIANKELLSDVSLRLSKGDFHVFLGPNGAGKSTLLALISGDIAAANGELYLQNKILNHYSITELSQLRGILLQENTFAFSMTVREVCALGRSPYIEDALANENKSIIDKCLAELDLLHLADFQFTNLSGGEKQRLHIARVLCQDTALIILDEPMNSLDVRHQILLMMLLQKKASEGKAILAVMHDINLALRFASHITLLKEGKVFFQGEVLSIDSAKDFEDCFDLRFTFSREEKTQLPQVLFPLLL